jgi:hypothetical protein
MRPTLNVKVVDFLGLDDATPASIGDQSSSALQNAYKRRRGIRRRNGFSFVATAATLTDPTDVSLTGLEFYYRSDDVAGADGSSVSAWTDRSSHSRNLSQGTGANQPVLRRTGAHASPNGTPLVQFDGTDDFMSAATSVTVPASTAGFTFYFYYERIAANGGNNGETLVSFPVGTGIEVLSQTGTNGGYANNTSLGAGNSSGFMGRHATGTAALGRQVLAVVFNPPAADVANIFRFYKNGVQQGTDQNGWNQAIVNQTYFIGGNGGGAFACNSALGAALMYSQAHDAATITAVSAWLTAFFGG